MILDVPKRPEKNKKARKISVLRAKWSLLNLNLSGWINYNGCFYKSELADLLGYLNLILKKWARQKYKKLHGHKVRASDWLEKLAKTDPNLFAHWRIGIRP